MRHALHHGIQDIFHTFTRFATGTDDIAAIAADEFHNLVLHLVGHGRRHIYFVDDWNNLQIVVDGHVEIGNGLGLHTLRGIHHKQRSFTSSDGA